MRADEITSCHTDAGLTHIGGPLADVFKEILRRVELRQRLEAERGEVITDDEFLGIAERTGGMRL